MFGFFAGRRLRSLEERLERVENELKTANLDWDEVYAKCRKLMGRVAKDRARIEELDHTNEEPTPLQPREPGTGRFLTPRQLAIQQGILRRRQNGGPQ